MFSPMASAVDHGGRPETAAVDEETPFFEGDDWLTDDHDGQGEFQVVTDVKERSKSDKKQRRTKRGNARSKKPSDSNRDGSSLRAFFPSLTPTTGVKLGQGNRKGKDKPRHDPTTIDGSPGLHLRPRDDNYNNGRTHDSNDDESTHSAMKDDDDPYSHYEDTLQQPLFSGNGGNSSATSSTSTEHRLADLPIRLVCSVDNDTNNGTAQKHFFLLFRSMFHVDPELLIVGRDGQEFETPQQIPRVPAQFRQSFRLYRSSPANGKGRVTVTCRLRTKHCLYDFYNHTDVISVLRKRKLRIEHNPLVDPRVAKVGWLSNICPDNTNRDELREFVLSLLRKHMPASAKAELHKRTGSHDVNIAIQRKQQHYGTGSEHVSTRALEIICPAMTAGPVREALESFGPQGLHNRFTFVSSSLVSAAPEVMITKIRQHNNYLNQIRRIVVYGLPPSVLSSKLALFDADVNLSKRPSYLEFLLDQGHIDSVERTNKSDSLGKFFFVTSKDGLEAARKNVDWLLDVCRHPPLHLKFLFTPGSIRPRRKDQPILASAPGNSSSSSYGTWIAAGTSSSAKDSSNPVTSSSQPSPLRSFARSYAAVASSSSTTTDNSVTAPSDQTRIASTMQPVPDSPDVSALQQQVKELSTAVELLLDCFQTFIQGADTNALQELHAKAKSVIAADVKTQHKTTTDDSGSSRSDASADDSVPPIVDDNNNNNSSQPNDDSGSATFQFGADRPCAVTPPKPSRTHGLKLPPDISVRAKQDTRRARSERQQKMKDATRHRRRLATASGSS